MTKYLPSRRIWATSLFSVFVAIGALGVTGCHPELGVLHNVQQNISLSTPLQQEQVREAIIRALISKSWRVQQDSPNKILAEISVSGHNATIEISYDATKYSITHVSSSEGLKYENEGDREVIHRRYNHWIASLDKIIYAELQKLIVSGNRAN